MKKYFPRAGKSKCFEEKGYRFIKWASYFCVLLIPAFFVATLQAADTKMKHSPPGYFVSGHRIQLEVDVRNPGGINLVRCYFKAFGEADLVFVPMNPSGADNYAGILPAPSAATGRIEYLFLAVNGANQVVRSQTFYISKDDTQKKPAWQEISEDGEIRVGMELDIVPTELRGFSDNITIDVAESGARFGVVALLYEASQTGSGAGLSGSAASATSAGSITAETAGLSTTTMVAAGAVGAAAIAGGAAAAGGGSGGGDKAESLTETSILGDWEVKGTQLGYSIDGTFIFHEDNVFRSDIRSTSPAGESSSSGINGTWALNGTSLTLFYPVAAGTTLTGNADGNSRAFVFLCDDGVCNLNFKR